MLQKEGLMNLIYIELFAILLTVLALPFLVKKIEDNLEVFLFIIGSVAVSLTMQWSTLLIREALIAPVKITAAVFLAGFVFRFLQRSIAESTNRIIGISGIKWFVFLIIVVLGFLSSVITAIIASLILVEIINCLKLDRKLKVKIVVLACFSIGLGAALTPIGEPLSTIVIAKLQGGPYRADFFFLARHLGYYIFPGIAAFGILGAVVTGPRYEKSYAVCRYEQETVKDIFIRTGKVYLFVMALIFLGAGFKPLIDAFISKIPYKELYWINTISAILDNATLAAAEIGPNLQIVQIKAALLGLLISGGMLIPGNIPNIISAGKLKIKSSEWAKFGIPLGLITMVIYFLCMR